MLLVLLLVLALLISLLVLTLLVLLLMQVLVVLILLNVLVLLVRLLVLVVLGAGPGFCAGFAAPGAAASEAEVARHAGSHCHCNAMAQPPLAQK